MARPAFTVLRGGRVLDARTRAAPFADVLIEGDTIRAVGPPGLAAPEAARMIDASQRMLAPGLVNAHTHGHGALGKGRGDRWTLELLLNAGPWISGGRTHDDRRLATLLNAADMIRRGATAAYDLTWEMPAPSADGLAAVAEAYATVGMRAVVAPMVADRTVYQAVPGLRDALPDDLARAVDKLALPPFDGILSACRSAARDWPHASRGVGFALAPTIPMHCSDPFLEGCRELAREHGLPVHTHLAESKIQALAGVDAYGCSIVRHLDRLGLVGPRFTGAHGVWLDNDDIAILAARGAGIAHNPGSNLRLGSGIAPARRLRTAGVTVGIGSDGSNSSDNQNMVEAMRLASYASRVASHDVTEWIGADEALAMATEGGARLIGHEGRLGRVAPGYLADIVFLDLGDLAYVPLNDPVNQFVHADDGGAVMSVMIGGRMVYEERRFTTIDLDKLRREAAAAMDRLNGATAEARALATRLEPLVASFCACFAGRAHGVNRMIPR